MKLIIFLAFAAAAIFFASEKNPVAGKEKKLKVAAYNVEYSAKGSAREIAEVLKPYDFDIVCFSEAPGGNWTREVAQVLGLEHVVVGRYTTAGHKNKYKTIVSRTPLYKYEEVLMADTLHTATRALTRIGDQEFAIYSVHFPFGWRDQAHIDETTNKITAFVNALKKSQSDRTIPLVMGDFNFILSSPEQKSPYYELFRAIGLDVTWTALGVDVTRLSTICKFDPEEKGTGRVIDHIMYNPQKMNVLESQIIEMEKPLSDHKPVWALLQY